MEIGLALFVAGMVVLHLLSCAVVGLSLIHI